MNQTVDNIVTLVNYAKANDIKIKHILVNRTELNAVRLGMMSMGMNPVDYYDPKIPGRNIRFNDVLLIEDLKIAEIHAEVAHGSDL